MAYVMFNPSTVNSDLSSTKSRMNFQKFINDYNNGLIDRGNTAKISSLMIFKMSVFSRFTSLMLVFSAVILPFRSFSK